MGRCAPSLQPWTTTIIPGVTLKAMYEIQIVGVKASRMSSHLYTFLKRQRKEYFALPESNVEQVSRKMQQCIDYLSAR